MLVSGLAPVPPSCPEISTTSLCALATPAAIVPNGRAVSIITINDSLKIADVNVTVNVTFPRMGDLVIHLQAPDGTDVVLMKQMGGPTADMIGTTFDDEAGTHISLGRGPYTGSFQPLTALSILDGKLATGTWKLWVEDRGGVYSGTLNSWSLTIAAQK